MERGRELRADYKLVARALTRKGNALAKLGRLEEAIGVYQKSLTEHRWVDGRVGGKQRVAGLSWGAWRRLLGCIRRAWRSTGGWAAVAPRLLGLTGVDWE